MRKREICSVKNDNNLLKRGNIINIKFPYIELTTKAFKQNIHMLDNQLTQLSYNGKPPFFLNTLSCNRFQTPIDSFIANNYNNFRQHRQHKRRRDRRRRSEREDDRLIINSPLIYNNNTLNTSCFCALCRQKDIYYTEREVATTSQGQTPAVATTTTTAIPIPPNVIPFTELYQRRKHHHHHHHHHQHQPKDIVYSSQFYSQYVT